MSIREASTVDGELRQNLNIVRKQPFISVYLHKDIRELLLHEWVRLQNLKSIPITAKIGLNLID